MSQLFFVLKLNRTELLNSGYYLEITFYTYIKLKQAQGPYYLSE